MSADSSSEVYVVGEFSGDDMCGGLNIYGVFTTERDAEDHQQALIAKWRYASVGVYPIPLDSPGVLGYMSYGFTPDD